MASIQKAVNLIDSVNDGTSEYEIRLNTDFTDNSSSEYPVDNDYAYIKIKPAKTLNLKIGSSDTSKKTININRSSSKLGRILSVNSTDSTTSPTNLVTLYLENIIFKNGNKDDGGACNFHNAKITIKNCEFNNNTASSSGGAISARDTVTELNIESTSFYQNRVHVLYNSTNGFGGAIDLLTGCNLTNCTFRENHVERESSAGSGLCHGGAIYASFGETIPNRVLNVEGCSFINNTSEIRGTGGAITITGNTILNLNSTTSVNPTIFKYNYSPEANAIKHLGDELNIYDKVYFNNLNNSENSLYSTYSSYDSKIDIVYAQKLMSGGGYKYPSINLNFTKSDDKTLSQVFPTDCYSNNYIYAVIKPINNTGVSLTDKNITIKDNNSEDAKSNHIYKFIPIETVDLNNRKYFLTNQGQFTFSPELSSLLQCPEGMDGQDTNTTYKNYILVKSKEDIARLLEFYPIDSSESKQNLYIQTNDIDLSGDDFIWQEANFTDEYDGQGYKLSNLVISGNYHSTGLFSNMKNASLKNIVLENPQITTNYTDTDSTVGSICGTMISSKINNCSVINALIKGKKYVGGILGTYDSTTSGELSYIINSSFNGIIQYTSNNASAKIGGLLAFQDDNKSAIHLINNIFNGEIQNPYPNDIDSGFIAGQIESGFIINSFCHGKYSQIGTHTYSITASENSVINCYVDINNFTDEEKLLIPKKMTLNDSTYKKQSLYSLLGDDYLEGDLIISGTQTDTKHDIYKFVAGSGGGFRSQSTSLKSVYTISDALNIFVSQNNSVTAFKTKYTELLPWTYDETDGIHFSTDGTKKDPKPLICPALSSEPDPTDTTPIWIRCEEDFMALDGWNLGNTIELKTDLYFFDDYYNSIGSKISKAVSFILNGNNHEISYTYHNNSQGSFTPALISYAEDVTIKDLTVHADLYLCYENAHGSVLVSSMKKGTIDNCHCVLDYGTFDDSSPHLGLIFGGIVGHITSNFDEDPMNSTDSDSGNDVEIVEITNCSMKFLSLIQFKFLEGL